METFLNWLSANPIIANILLAVLIVIVLSLVIMFIIAFRQGREISFYPPKIGSKPSNAEQNDKKTLETSIENSKAANVLSAVGDNEKPHKKSSLATSYKRITEEEIKSLIRKHNDDFCKVLDSRDNRYIKATTTDKGVLQFKQSVIDLLGYMQENKIKFTHPVEISLLNWRFASDNKVTATTDETWEEKYIDGHVSQLIDRNIYEIIFDDSTWLIDSCEVLPPVEKP